MNEPYPELARGSESWNTYASYLVDDTVEGLRETQSKFLAYRREKRMEGDARGVAYTDMQLGCIADALAAKGAS
jgi:hypothetical protein